jgi:hypothetical protein
MRLEPPQSVQQGRPAIVVVARPAATSTRRAVNGS